MTKTVALCKRRLEKTHWTAQGENPEQGTHGHTKMALRKVTIMPAHSTLLYALCYARHSGFVSPLAAAGCPPVPTEQISVICVCLGNYY